MDVRVALVIVNSGQTDVERELFGRDALAFSRCWLGWQE